MSKFLYNLFRATPWLLTCLFIINGLNSKQAQANEVNADVDSMLGGINHYNKTSSMNQVTSVSQLRDVSPTDWAYEALRSLVERYGCIVGYPDRTFRGNRALSRYEFAAGLNACMQQMERLIAQSEAVLREDLELLKRLMKEFESELASLGARVDNLEGRVAFLEDHQFSTTTKLKGEVLFAFTGQGGPGGLRSDVYDGEISRFSESGTQSTLSDRVRLNLLTSFTGKDLLKTRLSAGNVPNLGGSEGFGTDMARLNFEQNTGNDIGIDRLYYRTPVGDNATFWVGTALPPQEIYETFSPFTQSDGTGSLSRATRFNPLIYRTNTGGGVGFNYEFNDVFDLTASYLAGDADDPSGGNGIFNGIFSAGVQLGINPTENLSFGISYMHNYFPEGKVNLTGSTGSNYGNFVSNSISNGITDGGFKGTKDPFSGAATTSENVGIQANWRVTDNINLAAWGGWAGATAKSIDSTGVDRDGDYTDIWTWNANLSFLDLLKDGSVLTLGGGQLPRAGSVEGTFGRDRAQSWIIEGNYNYPVNNNISVTPGVYAIFNPNNNDYKNTTIIVGVLRTVFKF